MIIAKVGVFLRENPRFADDQQETVGGVAQLATRCGSTIPARGIGSIMGSNPIPILVPCHRVVAGNGLGGYSGGDGVASKQVLLALEGQLPAGLW